MISRQWGDLLLRPEDLEPSHESFEVVGVSTRAPSSWPARSCCWCGWPSGRVRRRAGYTPLPRWDAGKGPVIDWLPDGELDPIDPRVVLRKSDGLVRLNFLSTFALSAAGMAGRSPR